jgi:hypothetical protein
VRAGVTADRELTCTDSITALDQPTTSLCSSPSRPPYAEASDADDDMSVILLPSPPPSSPLRFPKKRKAATSLVREKRRHFVSDRAIEIKDSDEEDNIITITDTESDNNGTAIAILD